jgi:hypothetical protein
MTNDRLGGSGLSDPAGQRSGIIVNLIVGGLCFMGIAIGAGFGIQWIADQAAHDVCPRDSFVVGSNAPAWVGLLVLLSTFTAAAALTALALSLIGSRGPVRFVQNNRRLVFSGLGIAMATLVAVLPFVAFDTRCVSPAGIELTDWPWEGAVRYGWANVTGVTTECFKVSSKSSNDWRDDVTLTLKTGAHVPVGGGEWPVGDIRTPSLKYRRIADALRGRPVAFDNAQVASGCNPVDIRALERAPAG